MTPNTPTTSKGWRASVEARAERAERDVCCARPPRTPRSQKLVRAKQAELYVEALGLAGACAAMKLGPWQIHSLRRWLRGGASVPHNRGAHVKTKLSAEDRAAIRAARGEKSAYLAALYGVHDASIRRIWAGWEPKA